MNDHLVSDKHPFVSLLFILASVLIGFTFIGPLIGMGLSSLIFDVNVYEAMKNPDASLFMPIMLMQGVSTAFGLIVMPLLYVTVISQKPIRSFFRQEKDIKIFAVLIVLGLAFLIGITPVTEWNMNLEFPDFMKGFATWARELEDELANVTRMLTNFETPLHFIIALIVVAILPGIGEELVFRGLIQREIFRGTNNIHFAIWTSAILFSAIHMQFFGFVPRMLLGGLFGYIYHWSRNLAIPMFAHFFHNGFTLTMIYLYQTGAGDLSMEEEEAAPWPLVSICIIATVGLLFYIRNFYRKQFTA